MTGSRVSLATIVAALATIVLATAASAQEEPEHIGRPHDWSHSHLVFSNPGTREAQLKRGASQRKLAKWQATQDSLRFQLQRAARHVRGSVLQGVGQARKLKKEKKAPLMQRDWNVPIGNAPAPGAFPAKYTFDVNATPDCTNDYLAVPVDVSGLTRANLIGFNNLYVPGLCGGGNSPSFRFAYRIGNGAIRTSPVVSLDGAKIAFVESVLGASKFHVLQIGTAVEGSSITGVIPGVPPSNAVDRTPAGDLGALVTNSSPFVDYDTDTAYLGDDAGFLHKFTCVFDPLNTGCTLAEAGSPWPVDVTTGFLPTILTGPVFDGGSNIYIGSNNNRLYCITTAGAACGTAFVSVGPAGGLLDTPIVDGSTGYVFVASENLANSILVQAAPGLSSAVTVTMGPANPSFSIHNGAFDHGYLTGPDPSAGFMYFCGVAAAGVNPTLYRVGFNSAGLINATNDGNSLRLVTSASDSDGCSALTEIYNPNTPGGPTDLLFVAIAQNNHGCAVFNGYCVGSLDITSAFPTFQFPSAFRSIFPLPSADTSGIVLDNVSDVVPPWLAITAYAVGDLIIDSNGNIQQCITPGTSGGSHPTWSTAVDGTTADVGLLQWIMRGPYFGSWQPSQVYTANSIVNDSSDRLQRTNGGTSGPAQPAFTSTVTPDNGMIWTNQGSFTPSGVASLYFSSVGSGTTYKVTQEALQ